LLVTPSAAVLDRGEKTGFDYFNHKERIQVARCALKCF